jgi:hypothetical protein
LASYSNKLNPFWRDILLKLSELLAPKADEENSIINILSVSPFGLILILNAMVFLLLLK